VEFKSPNAAAVSAPGSCHEAVVTEDGPRSLRELGTCDKGMAYRWADQRVPGGCEPPGTMRGVLNDHHVNDGQSLAVA
jgi:hypothetical protein